MNPINRIESGLGRLVFFIGLFAGLTSQARAGNHLQFFFPIPNDTFTTFDDEVVAKSIFWASASEPVQWVLYNPGGQALVQSSPAIPDAQIIEAMRRALKEWNSVSISSFDYSESIWTLTNGLTPSPAPVEARLDGHNIVTFRSSLLTSTNDVVLGASIFFLERDVSRTELAALMPDAVESSAQIPVDLNNDNVADVRLANRDYRQAEIIEVDLVFNRSATYRLWPESIDDVPSSIRYLVYGSLDIQALLTGGFGLAQGVGPALLRDSSMYTIVEDSNSTFPTDPYNVRDLAFDDELAAGLLYPNFGSSLGEIRGQTLDGQFISSLPPGASPDPTNPNTQDSLFVVQAPVFLGRPANQFPAGVHPDVVASDKGLVRLIAQVMSGQSLRYPTRQGGVATFEPATSTDPNIDFTDHGEDFNGNGRLDVGEDLNNNGVLDPSTRSIDGTFRFRGLTPRTDYIVYMDRGYMGAQAGSYSVNPVADLLTQLENFPPEFFGGANCNSARPDDAENDYDLAYTPIAVTAGQVVSGIDLVTNVATATLCPTPVPSPTPSAFGNNAQITGFEIPALAKGGDVVPITIFVKNIGTSTWGENHRLATIYDVCLLFPTRMVLPVGMTIPPGQTAEFSGSVTIPANIVGGTCQPRFQMVEEFVEFFGEIKQAAMTLDSSVQIPFASSPPAQQGWTGAALAGTAEARLEAGGLCMEVGETGNNIALWYSPERLVELVDLSVYRLRVAATTNQTATDRIPFWNVIYDNFNTEGFGNIYGGESWFLDVAGGANGVGRANGRTTFDVYAIPNAALTPQWRGLLADGTEGAFTPGHDASNDMRLSIRVLDLESAPLNSGIDWGKICIGSINVARYPTSNIFFQSTVYNTPISNTTHRPKADGQNPVFAAIDDQAHVAYYRLAPTTDRASLFPAVDLQPPLQVYSVASLYPVTWDDNALYRVTARIQITDSESGVDPVDALQIAVDTSTVELGQTNNSTRGSAPDNMFRSAAPRRGVDAGGDQVYVAYFFSNNATDVTLPDYRRLRPLVDFFNVPELFGTGTGSDLHQINALQVDRLTPPQ